MDPDPNGSRTLPAAVGSGSEAYWLACFGSRIQEIAGKPDAKVSFDCELGHLAF